MTAADIEHARTTPIEHVIDQHGIKLCGRIERVGPCPLCGGTDRFSINIKKQVFNCRGCNVGGDVIALVQHLDGCTFTEAIELLSGDRVEHRPRQERQAKPTEPYELKQQRKAAFLWSRRQPITGTTAEKYLRVRGISGPLPETLAFLPPSKRDQHPAMIASFSLCDGARVDAVHLTLLKPDGSGKADIEHPKIVVGRPLGRPIVLSAPNDTLALAITEGIEDGLTVAAVTGLETWAAASAPYMPALADVIPDCIETVTIFAHDDKSGRNGALALAEKLYGLAIEVFIEGIG